jgi:hypothetical protein
MCCKLQSSTPPTRMCVAPTTHRNSLASSLPYHEQANRGKGEATIRCAVSVALHKASLARSLATTAHLRYREGAHRARRVWGRIQAKAIVQLSGVQLELATRARLPRVRPRGLCQRRRVPAGPRRDLQSAQQRVPDLARPPPFPVPANAGRQKFFSSPSPQHFVEHLTTAVSRQTCLQAWRCPSDSHCSVGLGRTLGATTPGQAAAARWGSVALRAGCRFPPLLRTRARPLSRPARQRRGLAL